MIKRALPTILGLLGLCLPLVAQESDLLTTAGTETITRERLQQTGEIDTAPALTRHRPDIFSTFDGSLLIHDLPVLTLVDGRRLLTSSALARMGTEQLDFLPVAFLQSVQVQPISPSLRYGSDAPGGVVDLRLNRDYSGGEIGVFYGKSGGRYDREDFQTYFIGGAGNDKVHFTAGAVYQESSGHIPVRGR